MDAAKSILAGLKATLVNDANAHEWNKLLVEMLVMVKEPPKERISTPPSKPRIAIVRQVPISNDRKTAYRRPYTLAELQDWDEIEIDGFSYGVNRRGDLINGDGEYVGWWSGRTADWSAPEPDDWRIVMA